MAVKDGQGGATVKFVINVATSTDPNAEYNMSNYGTFLASFGAPDGTLLGNHIVDVHPKDAIRPAVTYEFYDAMTGKPISRTVHLNVVDGNGVTSSASGQNTVDFPAGTVSQGALSLTPSASGYLPYVEKLVRFNALSNSSQTVRIFLNPKNNPVTGNMFRVILSWSDEPRDLDLHVYTSDGRHVFYGSKSASNINLDVDVTNGRGPETMTIEKIESGVTYYFYVHHYSGSSSLPLSQASLRIIGIPGLTSLQVPQLSVQGIYWRCFSYRNGTFTVKNDVISHNTNQLTF